MIDICRAVRLAAYTTEIINFRIVTTFIDLSSKLPISCRIALDIGHYLLYRTKLLQILHAAYKSLLIHALNINKFLLFLINWL